MKKSEIIIAVAYAGIPSGSKFVKHDLPGTNLAVAEIDVTKDSNGLRVMMAEAFANQLTYDLRGHSEDPTPALFEKIHHEVVEYYQTMIEGMFVDEVVAETLVEYRGLITRLLEIAASLHIEYHIPKDPFECQ